MSVCYMTCVLSFCCFFFSSRRRHTRCALVTGVQTCALPISEGEWTDLSAAALAEMMQVNLSAPVMLAKTLVAASEGKRPAIVHIVDQRVVHPVPDQIAYSLSKSALWQATATLAVAFGSRARVNAVAPGLTMATDDYSAGQIDRLAKLMPLGELPVPAQIADAVASLARAAAVTGKTIFVHGGAHPAPMARDVVGLGRG